VHQGQAMHFNQNSFFDAFALRGPHANITPNILLVTKLVSK